VSLSPEDMKRIGASDMPALLGKSPWSGPVALWARIVHGHHWGGNEATKGGHAAEDYNRALYRQATGYALEGPPKSLRHPLLPWARCSPDDTAVDTPDGRRGVEFKRAQSREGWGALGTDEVPESYWLQVQAQGGFCLDTGFWDTGDVDLSVLLFGEQCTYPVQHVPEAWERMQAAGERFWRDFVVTQRCPEGPNLVLLERDAEALLALYPRPKPKSEPMRWEALTAEQQALVTNWLEANAARRSWEKNEKALSRQVQHLLREVPGLVGPGWRVDFAATKETATTDWEKVAREMTEGRFTFSELVTKHTTMKSTRPLVGREEKKR